jgi:hypothetical protein
MYDRGVSKYQESVEIPKKRVSKYRAPRSIPLVEPPLIVKLMLHYDLALDI